ncbi:YpjP family protein, partial [Alkalihalophilus pseudofirmus]
FGTRIKPVIENEFREMILPNIETALAETAAQFPQEDLKHLIITEQPGKGLSEKIFHIKNVDTGKDIVRFHVRREHPPQSGYWFN